MTWHNGLRKGSANLAIKDFMTFHVRNNSLVHTSCTMKILKAHIISQMRASDPQNNNLSKLLEDSGNKGNLLIWDL